ncbi:MAG TPA: GGDEF domain-containing protein [Methylotenera sp.]|nr:GGDEF domain-containing protein [Methylotenera sp.]HPH04339.1 GGDEF domain-containing protein [Methylotenera sp.]HPM99893.1 GGDEF domain-containing protein [Methylotenera sp.]
MHKTPVKVTAQDLQLIHQSKIFAGVNVDDLSHLIADCTLHTISAGQTLIQVNTKNEHCNIILTGALRVFLEAENNEQFITLAPGDCVGELSIFDGSSTSARVVAENDSLLLRIKEETLWRLVRASHNFSRNLLLMLAKRMRNDNDMIINGLRHQHELEKIANIDGLTGLYNRRWMNEFFKRQINRAKSDKKPLVLMLADLDHFKKVNDQYGHVVGDEVLSAVASVLPHQFRPTDLLARFGGEEFAMILPNTDLAQATQIAERVRIAIASTRVEFYPEIQLTLSLGLANLLPSDDMSSLLTRADHALYQAKENGRNRVEIG